MSDIIKIHHRLKSSGSVPPNARSHVFKLVAALIRLKQRFKPTQSDRIDAYDRALLMFLYLWITGNIEACQHERDLPDLCFVSGTQPCGPHRLRRVRRNNPSWVEYAQPYLTRSGLQWHWQPMPTALNPWFYQALSHMQTGDHSLHLCANEKTQFIAFLHTKWRTPVALLGCPLVRRDTFYRYFQTMVRCDPTLPITSKYISLQGKHISHHSAFAYQTRNSNQIRYDLFWAQNRYLDRLARALPACFLPLLSPALPVTRNTQPLLAHRTQLQPYLEQPALIESFHLQLTKATKNYTPIPPVVIGSSRQLDVKAVRRFFHLLEQQAQKLNGPTHSLESLKTLHNFLTNQLALLFIVLTSARPTHAISIERQYCFDHRFAIIFDKGRYRSVWLCDYLRDALLRLSQFQHQLQLRIPTMTEHSYLWFEVNDADLCVPLCARSLRAFMNTWWSKANPHCSAVPYQLRHFFAQHALNTPNAELTTVDIDRLMGHATYGEQLGSDAIYLAKQHKLTRFLNALPSYLRLPSLTHTKAKDDA
ncbi:hypothetical protein VTH8203_03394 [Vibrio thalassae]|uniref:Phage integrase family protein n=1 Tax=Vibrio thalassae TaxID=1243014 RepID=A0A240EMA7_9VIBR|nr:hypothetical protein [Vibrio thalassae]SNX49746.1 hypothetical protein VTH8203_03394 [Vibrio thalassae]